MYLLLFYIFIFFLPSNLGYHFVYPFSYVNGLLVDYLIPTLYLQDILLFVIIVYWLFLDRKLRADLSKLWFSHILLLFLISLFFSVLVSINYFFSVFAFLKLMLYVFFALTVGFSINIRKHWHNILKVFSVSLILLCTLSILQFVNQGSVFDNYLVLGEQPYSFSTYGISKESFFGRTIIPPYGLFRHPNILAGYLSIVLIWLVGTPSFIQKYKKLFMVALVLGVVVLFLTNSATALLAFSLGLFMTYILKSPNNKVKVVTYLFSLILLFFSAFLLKPLDSLFPNNPSIYRRLDLHHVVIDNLDKYFLFGSGIGTSTELSANYFDYFDEIKYPQPVHNIFALMTIEGGIISTFFYVLIFLFILFPLKKKENLFQVTFLQFILLGLFDHYLLTIHQMVLLFWLTVSFHFAYNYSSWLTRKDNIIYE